VGFVANKVSLLSIPPTAPHTSSITRDWYSAPSGGLNNSELASTPPQETTATTTTTTTKED
jgi:hypothetical protein